jgi:hypothetical protein
MLKHGCLLMCLALGTAGCGNEPSPPPRTPAPTVSDPLVRKQTTVPAAVELAQAPREPDARPPVAGAADSPPPGARR